MWNYMHYSIWISEKQQAKSSDIDSRQGSRSPWNVIRGCHMRSAKKGLLPSHCLQALCSETCKSSAEVESKPGSRQRRNRGSHVVNPLFSSKRRSDITAPRDIMQHHHPRLWLHHGFRVTKSRSTRAGVQHYNEAFLLGPLTYSRYLFPQNYHSAIGKSFLLSLGNTLSS